MMSGLLIAFEGIDGSGKSTQVPLVARAIRERYGFEVVESREPGSTDLGHQLRKLMLNKNDYREGDPDPLTLALMMLADRNEHVQKVIIPALLRNAVVLTDRYHSSTVVYQGCGAGVELDLIDKVWTNIKNRSSLLYSFHSADANPRLNVFLDVPIDVAERRNKKGERWDNESLDFRMRLLSGYERLIAEDRSRWLRVCANHPQVEVTERIMIFLEPILDRYSQDLEYFRSITAVE